MLSNQADRRDVILVMRLDAIGDFVIWSDSAKAYRELYPSSQYKIILLGHEVWKDLALQLHIFDEVWGMDRKKFMLDLPYRRHIFGKINVLHFHTIIYHTYSREFASGDLIVKRLLATRKIGIVSDNAIDDFVWTKISHSWYTQVHQPASHGHELLKNEAFLHCLGMDYFKASLPVLPMHTSCPCDELDLPGTYYVIFPSARVGLRKWDDENYAAIAEKMAGYTTWHAVICGSGAEFALGDKIQKRVGDDKVTNLCGKTTLLQLTGVIHKAKLLIGNETSGIHLAAALQTPSVCILGGGHFGRFVPYPDKIDSPYKPVPVFEPMTCFNCDWNCKYQVSKIGTVPCIKRISIERVWECVMRAIKGQ